MLERVRPKLNQANGWSEACHSLLRRVTLMGFLGISLFLLVGCPARWKVVFINGVDAELSVQLSGALNGSQRSFRLLPRCSHSELLGQVQRLAVFDASGALMFEHEDFGSRDLAPPLSASYPHIYVLLTSTNACVIPPDYRKTWKEHFGEITKRGE